MRRQTKWLVTIVFTGALTVLAGCAESPIEPTAPATNAEAGALPDGVASAHPRRGRHHVGDVRGWLRRLRWKTARYRNLDRAIQRGYDTALTACMESDAGGMGVHYGNVALIDAVVEELEPEVLLYEPGRHGRMRLVAVEYVVPFDLWTADQPPSLNGVSFHRNEGFGLWVLHAWAWKANPAGALEDWNPRVSCRYAD